MISSLLIFIFILGGGFYLQKKFTKGWTNFSAYIVNKKQKAEILKWRAIVKLQPTEDHKMKLKTVEATFEILSINRYVTFLKDTGRYSICPSCEMPKDITYPTCSNCNSYSHPSISQTHGQMIQKELEAQAGEAMIEWWQQRG
jgi:hypothetical protein